jgi:DNA-binding NtrC family response regulator
VSSEEGLKMAREEVVERIVRTTLGETGHNVSEAARRLGITREHLYYYIKKYGIVRPEEEP